MSDLQHRQDKIIEKMRMVSERDFIKYVGSWFSLNFYKNQGKITIFPESERRKHIITNKEYYAKDRTNNGVAYNETKSFFEQYKQLCETIERSNTVELYANENSEYANCGFGAKNAYLSFVVGLESENIFYSTQVREHSNHIFNSLLVTNGSDNIYQSRVVTKSFNVFFSSNIFNSSNIWFSNNLMGCSECIHCDNLENKNYCIENKEYNKAAYLEKKKEILSQKDRFAMFHQKVLQTKSSNFASTDVTGQGLYRCSNIKNGVFALNMHDSENIFRSDGLDGSNNFINCIDTGTNSKHFYGICAGGERGDNCYIGNYISRSSHCFYSHILESCSFCFGCIGLKNKQFCILNKQYNKDEWYQKVNEIFAQMEQDGTLGQFFPGSMNPLYFNDTAAYLIDDSFTKEEVAKEGYLWRDEEIKVDIPAGADVVETQDLASYQRFSFKKVREIDPEILKKVIKDEKGNYYRIVKMEYDFLMKHGLPLPELHWLERIKLGFKFK